jgi:hypothetical protein
MQLLIIARHHIVNTHIYVQLQITHEKNNIINVISTKL